MRDAALAAIPPPPTSTSSSGSARARRRPVTAGAGEPGDRCAPSAGPQGRPDAGRQARGAVNGAGSAQRSWMPKAKPASSSRKRSTSRSPRIASRRRPPSADHDPGALRRHLRRDGLGGRRGPRGRGRVAQLRCAQPGAGPPARTMQDTFWLEPADGGLVLRTHTSPVQARTMLDRRRRSTSSAPAGCSAPTSWTRPTPRSSRRSRGLSSTRASRWPTSRAPSTTSRRRCSVTGS